MPTAAANQGREEYVEIALARRKRPAAEGSHTAGPSGANEPTTTRHGAHEDVSRTLTEPPPDLKLRPAMQGKLQEVDLGEEARARNIAMTERARRRLEGQSLADDDDDDVNPDQRKKVRLGPDGKPWRSRKRRASDDVKRDQIIEQFLSENRCKLAPVYNLTAHAGSHVFWRPQGSHAHGSYRRGVRSAN